MLKIEAYTDGSCKNNPGPGGWGWIVYVNPELPVIITWSDWGGNSKTTNQRMELTAMAEFLAFCPMGKHVYIHVYSDSMYVLGGIIGKTKDPKDVLKNTDNWLKLWVHSTVKLGDTLTSKYWTKEPANSDIWYLIHQSLLKHKVAKTTIIAQWIKGHSKNKGNNTADTLSNMYHKK